MVAFHTPGEEQPSGGGGFGGIMQVVGGEITNARGNVFDQGRIVPFARGAIVDRPLAFPTAGGLGLMGEAGPEAIMSLARTPGGKLGVHAAGNSPQLERIERLLSQMVILQERIAAREDLVVVERQELGAQVQRDRRRRGGLSQALRGRD